jgi:L-fuculose-phosphate aldolase
MTSTNEINELRAQVADSSHILDHQGLVDFHGHVSARIPGTDTIIIKPVLRAHNQITAADLVEVDMDAYIAADGSQWDPSKQVGRTIDTPVPPRETMLHIAIYKARADVNSVVHTHQLISTAIGIGRIRSRGRLQPGGAFARPFRS